MCICVSLRTKLLNTKGYCQLLELVVLLEIKKYSIWVKHLPQIVHLYLLLWHFNNILDNYTPIYFIHCITYHKAINNKYIAYYNKLFVIEFILKFIQGVQNFIILIYRTQIYKNHHLI